MISKTYYSLNFLRGALIAGALLLILPFQALSQVNNDEAYQLLSQVSDKEVYEAEINGKSYEVTEKLVYAFFYWAKQQKDHPVQLRSGPLVAPIVSTKHNYKMATDPDYKESMATWGIILKNSLKASFNDRTLLVGALSEYNRLLVQTDGFMNAVYDNCPEGINKGDAYEAMIYYVYGTEASGNLTGNLGLFWLFGAVFRLFHTKILLPLSKTKWITRVIEKMSPRMKFWNRTALYTGLISAYPISRIQLMRMYVKENQELLDRLKSDPSSFAEDVSQLESADKWSERRGHYYKFFNRYAEYQDIIDDESLPQDIRLETVLKWSALTKNHLDLFVIDLSDIRNRINEMKNSKNSDFNLDIKVFEFIYRLATAQLSLLTSELQGFEPLGDYHSLDEATKRRFLEIKSVLIAHDPVVFRENLEAHDIATIRQSSGRTSKAKRIAYLIRKKDLTEVEENELEVLSTWLLENYL